MTESCANIGVPNARRRPPVTSNLGQLRLSRVHGNPETATDPDAVPLGRALLWVAFGVVLVAGLVMYFMYERLVSPLLT